MKKVAFVSTLVLILVSCVQDKSYYEQFNKTKPITKRIEDLNKSSEAIRKLEKGKLNKEAVDYLEYEYRIGDEDSYVISYLFDSKGCYEIGIDGYFATQENAQLLLNEFKKELTDTYGAPEESNDLARWLTKNQAITLELDYANTDKGMAVATIFANQ